MDSAVFLLEIGGFRNEWIVVLKLSSVLSKLDSLNDWFILCSFNGCLAAYVDLDLDLGGDISYPPIFPLFRLFETPIGVNSSLFLLDPLDTRWGVPNKFFPENKLIDTYNSVFFR
jgi:hypothetical protein